jgi:hypothetical protein
MAAFEFTALDDMTGRYNIVEHEHAEMEQEFIDRCNAEQLCPR